MLVEIPMGNYFIRLRKVSVGKVEITILDMKREVVTVNAFSANQLKYAIQLVIEE